MKPCLFYYSAKVLKVVDGDTVWLDVDLGFNVRQEMSIRLWGINAPEMNTPEGKESKRFLQSYLAVGQHVILDSRRDKKEKYGRYLGVIYVDDVDINAEMIKQGYAKEYMRDK